jgi:ABC-2 type transport system permease protein
MTTEATTGQTATATELDASLLAVLSAGERPDRPSPVSAALTFGWRGLLKIKHVPEQLFDVTLTPILFTLMFTFIWGGAIEGSTGEYLQYILPGILVVTVVFTTVYSGVTMNTDITKGVVDRFRSLPISRSAPLVGPLLADSARYVLAALVGFVVGLILGYDADGGILGVIGAFAILVVFALGLAWGFSALGLVMKTPQGVMNFGFTLIFPLTFMSSAFVDPETMPDGLQAVVEQNPFTRVVTAVRGLLEGTASWGDIGIVLGFAALLTAIFMPLTIRLYRGHE